MRISAGDQQRSSYCDLNARPESNECSASSRRFRSKCKQLASVPNNFSVGFISTTPPNLVSTCSLMVTFRLQQ